MVPPLVTLEEHFLSTAVSDKFEPFFSEQFKALPRARERLLDLGAERLQEMDEGGVAVQVVSHVCAPRPLEHDECVAANDQLMAAVAAEEEQRRGRFAGFAVLPVAEPAAAAEELERCIVGGKGGIRKNFFVGALIDNHADGHFFDSPSYDSLWATAERLDVPIYLHPTFPADEWLPRFEGEGLDDGAAMSLGTSGWGWHTETGLHILRLYAAGVFDRFPKLKIVIGHFGEMIPFQLERICRLSERWGNRKRKFRQVWDENIWVTTSGVWSLDPLRCLLHNTKIDHILYSVDYPFASNRSGLEWMQELEASGLVTQEQLESISYKNAEKLLKLKVAVS